MPCTSKQFEELTISTPVTRHILFLSHDIAHVDDMDIILEVVSIKVSIKVNNTKLKQLFRTMIESCTWQLYKISFPVTMNFVLVPLAETWLSFQAPHYHSLVLPINYFHISIADMTPRYCCALITSFAHKVSIEHQVEISNEATVDLCCH